MTRGGRGRGGDGKGGGGGAEDERYLGRLRQYLGSLGDKRAKQHQKFGFVTIIPRGGPEEQQVEREDAIMHWEEFFLLLERCGGTVESGQLVSFHLREHTKGGGPSGNIKKKATCIYPEYEPAFHGTLPPDEINESGKVYQYSFMRFGEHNENFDSVVTEFQVNPAIPRKRELGTNGSLHWGTFTLARQIPPPVGGAGGPPMGPPPPVQPNWNDAANWCYNLQQQQAFVHYQQQQQLAYAQQQAMAPHPQFYSQACPMISPAPSSVAGQPSPPGPVPIHPNAGPDGGAESFAVRAQRACHQLFNNKENVAPRPKAMSAMSEAPPPKAAASSSLKALFVKEGGPDGVEDTPRDRTGSSNSVLPVPGASSTRRGNTSKESSDKKSGADREEVDLYKDLGVGSDTAKKKKAGERAAASDKSGGGDGKSRRKRSDSPNRSPNSPKCRKEDCGRPTRAQPPASSSSGAGAGVVSLPATANPYASFPLSQSKASAPFAPRSSSGDDSSLWESAAKTAVANKIGSTAGAGASPPRRGASPSRGRGTASPLRCGVSPSRGRGTASPLRRRERAPRPSIGVNLPPGMEAEKEMDQTKLSTIDEAQTLYLRNLDYLNSFTRRNELRTPVEKLLRQLPNRKALAWACTMWGYDTKQPAESDFNKKALAEHRRREKNSDSKRGSPRRRSRTRSNAPESYNKRDQPIVGGTSSSSTDGHANSISLDGSTTCTPKLATDAVKATTEKNISLAQDLLVKIDWKKKDVDPRSRRKESKEQRSRSRARSRSSRARKGPLRGRGRSRSSSDSSPPKSSQAAKSGSNTKGGSSAATSSGKDTALTAVAQSKGSVTGKGMGIPHATSISGAAGFSKKVESPRRRSRSRSRGSPRRRRPIGKSMAPSRLGAAASLRNTNTAVFDPAAAPRVERRSSRESAEMNRDEGSSRGADGGSKRRRTETDHDRGDVDTANNRTTRERSTPRALPPHLASLVRNCEKSAGEVQNRGRGSQRTNTNPNGPVEQVLESRSVDPQHDHRVETPRSNQPQLDLPRVPPENSHIRNDHQHNLNNHNHSLHHQNKYLPRGHDLHSADTSNIGGLGRQGGQPNDHGPPVAPLGAVGARQSSRERSRAAQLQHQQHPQNTSMMEQAGERDIHLSRNVDRDGRGAQDHFDHLMRRDERGPAPRDHPGHLMRRDERGPAPRSPGVHSFGASANTNSMASSALHHLPRNANVHQDHGSRDFPQTMEERRRETIAEVDRRSLPDSQHELDSITLPEDTVDKIRTKVRTFVALGQISAENAQETFKMLLDEIRKKRLEEQRRFLQRAEANPATGGGPPSADLSRTPLDRHEELRGVREQLHQREPHPRHPMNQHVERSPGSINNGAPRRTQPRPSMMRGIGMEDPGLMRNNGSFPLCARGLATGLSPRRRESAARRYISDARLPARTREQEVMLENSRVRGIPFQEPPLASAVNNTRPQEPELSSGQYLRRQQQHAPQREKEPSHLVNHQGSAPQATNQQAEQAAAVDPQSKQHIEKLLQETRAKLTHLKREEAKIKEEKEREERQTAREARNMSAAPSRGGRDRDPHRSRDTRGVSRARAQSSARSYRGSYR